MQKKTVSIIVPVYRSERYLERCINSLLAQTYRQIEIILVDDGSPDNSPALCDEFAQQNPLVRVIHQTNAGVSAARNTGLQTAEGEWVQFVDSDDWLAPDYTENLLHCAQRWSCDLVIAGFQVSDGRRARPDILPERDICVSHKELAEQFWIFFDQGLFNSPVNKLYRRTKITTFFDTQMRCGEDLQFNMCYLANADTIATVRAEGYFYFCPPESIGGVKYQNRTAYECFSYSNSVRFFLASELSEEQYRSRWEAFLFRNVCGDLKNIARALPASKAEQKVDEYLANPGLQAALEHRAWQMLPRPYHVVGWLLKKRCVKIFLYCCKLRKNEFSLKRMYLWRKANSGRA